MASVQYSHVTRSYHRIMEHAAITVQILLDGAVTGCEGLNLSYQYSQDCGG